MNPFDLIRAARKRVISKRIAWAVEAQAWYDRQARGAMAEKEAAERRESLLRQKLTEVDHPLPKPVLRSGRSLT